MGNAKVEAERTEAVLMRETIERYFLRASMRVKSACVSLLVLKNRLRVILLRDFFLYLLIG